MLNCASGLIVDQITSITNLGVVCLVVEQSAHFQKVPWFIYN